MTTVHRAEQILVRAPLRSTFDYVSDLGRHPEWSGGLSIEERTPGPIAVGKEYASRGEVAIQKDRPNTVRISVYEPPHRFGFIARDPDFGNVSHEFKFAQQGQDVLIIRTMTLSLHPIIAILFRFLVYPFLSRPSTRKSLASLKARAETM